MILDRRRSWLRLICMAAMACALHVPSVGAQSAGQKSGGRGVARPAAVGPATRLAIPAAPEAEKAAVTVDSAVESEAAEPPAPIIPPPPPEPPALNQPVTVKNPPHSDGLSLLVSWSPVAGVAGYALLAASTAEGDYEIIVDDLAPDATGHSHTLTSDLTVKRPPEVVYYRLASKGPAAKGAQQRLVAALLDGGSEPSEAQASAISAAQDAYIATLLERASPAAKGVPQGTWYDPSKLALLVLVIAMGALILYYTRAARQGKEIFIRRIPGVDAIEEAVGRATEMGKPVLYIPGIGEFQEIQTIASLLILGRVAEVVATYDSDIIVPCTYPIVREVADESVRQGYFAAGRPDAYLPQNVRFISSEQFAFTASVNGIILREKPAANIYLGQFFAESLILAETGFVNKSIQIAGTAETSQIPFFVTACDYTLIGEELYAVSAYLTREPRLTSSLRASDWIRLGLIALLVLGTLEMALFGSEVIKSALLLQWP